MAETPALCRRLGAFFVHVLLPIALGASVYLLFRSTGLLVFRWLDVLGLREVITGARNYTSAVRLPQWVLYSVPDGLWVYATTSWMILIWRGTPPWTWLAVGVIFGLGGELGQLFGFVPGTYENLDMVAYVASFLLALFVVRWRNETTLPFGTGPARHDCLGVR